VEEWWGMGAPSVDPRVIPRYGWSNIEEGMGQLMLEHKFCYAIDDVIQSIG